MAALEAARTIREKAIPLRHSLVVAGFTGEEGRDGRHLRKQGLAGLLQEPFRREKLSRVGLTADGILSAKGDPGGIACYFELHIEQGPYLERRSIPIGIPTGIVGISRYAVRLEGEANHAGTTPMKERKDAMREASELLSEWFAWTDTRDDFVCNVGVFPCIPGLTPLSRGGPTSFSKSAPSGIQSWMRLLRFRSSP